MFSTFSLACPTGRDQISSAVRDAGNRKTPERFRTGAEPSFHDQTKLRLFKRSARKRVVDAAQRDAGLSLARLVHAPKRSSLTNVSKPRAQPFGNDARFPAVDI